MKLIVGKLFTVIKGFLMKKIILFLFLVFALALTSDLFAQKENQDVMYLTNGVIHSGKIIEKTNSRVTIQTEKGTYKIPITSIEKIIQAGENTTEESKTEATEQKNDNNIVNITKPLSKPSNTNDFQPQTISYRNPGIATLMSLVFPGGGQFYNAQSSKGIGFFLWGSISNGVIIYALEGNIDSDTQETIIAIAGISALTCWIYGMYDANSMAKQINKGYINIASFNLGENKTLALNPDIRLVNSNLNYNKNNSILSYGINFKLSF